MDAFLNEVYKKKVSNTIKQRNREKKLQDQDLNLVTQPCNSATSEETAIIIPESSNSDNNEIISQDKTGKIRKKTEVDYRKAISETLCPGKIISSNISSIDEASKHLAQLCNKAFDAVDKANRANQEEILCWYLYAKDFRIQLNGIIENSE
ncbi:10116_t:CDS:2, partial [Acaulospora morrowiae]